MKRNEAYIDRIFRGYGEEFFGKETMDQVTSEQVEEARCFAYGTMSEVVRGMIAAGLDPRSEGVMDECKALFYRYIFEQFDIPNLRK